MGMNKDLEKEIKNDGFLKRNAKRSAQYVKGETYTYTNMKQVIFYKNFISDLISTLNPFNKKKRDAKYETFENTVKKKNLTESDLKDSFKYYSLMFWLGAFLMSAVLIVGSYLLFVKGNFWAIGPLVATMALSFAQMFTGSFRAFQINKRELCSVKYWYASRKFIPTSFKTNEEASSEKRREDKKSLFLTTNKKK